MLERFPLQPGSRRWYRDTWHAPRAGGRRLHEGTDIAAPAGTPIIAARTGRVLKVEEDAETTCGLGVFVLVHTSSGSELDGYCHMRAVPVVHEHETVQAGDVLGYVGATGNGSPGHPHLHFQIETLPGRVRRNPYAELRAVEVAERRSPQAQSIRTALARSSRASSTGSGLGLLFVLAAFAYYLVNKD